MRTCKLCGRTFPNTEEYFYADKRKNRPRSFCKKCTYFRQKYPDIPVVLQGMHTREALAVARRLLRLVEWAGRPAGLRERVCPVCGQAPDAGHFRTCQLAQFLAVPSKDMPTRSIGRIKFMTQEEIIRAVEGQPDISR